MNQTEIFSSCHVQNLAFSNWIGFNSYIDIQVSIVIREVLFSSWNQNKRLIGLLFLHHQFFFFFFHLKGTHYGPNIDKHNPRDSESKIPKLLKRLRSKMQFKNPLQRSNLVWKQRKLCNKSCKAQRIAK